LLESVLDEAESSGVSTKLLLAAVEVLLLRPLQAAREDLAATKARVLLLIDGLDELDLSEEGRNDFCAAWIALLEASPVGVYSVLSSSKDAAFERGLRYVLLHPFDSDWLIQILNSMLWQR
jgi:hypothetical protein